MPKIKHERSHRIAARLSDEEMAILSAEVERTGLDLSDVLRQAVRALRDRQPATNKSKAKR